MSVQAAGVEAFGDEVTLLELPEPRPLEVDEVLIEVRAAGVGNWEEFVRTGGWNVGVAPPLALGVEAAGEVVAVGSEVEWPSVGAAVLTHPLPLRDQGCWAERLIARAALVAEKADNVSWAEAAAFPVPALTAEQVLSDALNLQPGETILVNGAGGVTGRMIVELAAQKGATVIATASESSSPRVSALGARVVLDYRESDWVSRAVDAAGSSGIQGGVNAAPGGEADVLGAIADGGRLATITGAPPPAERGVAIVDVVIRPDGDQLRQLATLLAGGKLHLDVESSYPLAGAAQALAGAIKGVHGAVVLEP
jgi:NADPH:quinone reductase-like Zn-dependent oxidoreductase